MSRCTRCLMPSTRPDTPFTDGICAACISYANRPQIDWADRRKDLDNVLDRHNGQCIVPSSGGKDSTWQVLTLLEMGADVTIITASTCHLTPIGRRNIDNLARFARTIEVTPNQTVRAELNRLGLELVGDISWPEHASIFTTPFRMAVALNIPLIFYGESPQNQYGGPRGSEEARQMTQRWTEEYGGFLGLRPVDFIGMEGITDMSDYMFPPPDEIKRVGVEAHFLGQYLAWDSRQNIRKSIDNGFEAIVPCDANWWCGENLDNAQTGLHDYFGYLKYGYGRACAQLSVDMRAGVITRDAALVELEKRDGIFPKVYAGVPAEDVLDRIDMPRERLNELIEEYSC